MTTNSTTTLSKYIAQSGFCSRRQATEYIKQGKVKINGKTNTIPFTIIKDGDIVFVTNQEIIPAKKIYLLFNKPKNVICTLSDEKERTTISDLFKPFFTERLYPVGRLDRATTGLIIMTNDGDLSQRLSHPKYEVSKTYTITSKDFNISQKTIDKLIEGVELEDGFMKVDTVWYPTESKKTVSITIHSGKNLIVRRLFKALGFDDIKLDRSEYAGLTKENLPVGSWRKLTVNEITQLQATSLQETKKSKKQRSIKAKKYYARL